MRETLTALGPTELFTGPMADPIARKVKEIHCLADSTFTKLDFQFPAATLTLPVDPSDPSGVTFPALYIIGYVMNFQLLTGTIHVIYETAA